ncbi:MAG TPA: YXWGXW repeat-containing protein [Candidatus Acidoferrales bacterium]|nr:YXWGXW repeat-containing protein [Candidatus Acidoferrales bacterium]
MNKRYQSAVHLVLSLGKRLAAPLLLAFLMIFAPVAASAQVAVGVFVSYGPPALPVFVQPLCPGPGYFWTPGYWAWDPVFGYYWVPGTWVLAPFAGALWTPGYWGWVDADDAFAWYDGYWGPVVGFYGGIDYGFGYTGYGYDGGYWNHGVFYYNTAVNRINTTNITTVYNRTVVNNVNVTRVSYNGGSGGIAARPSAEQLAAMRERRSGPVGEQMRQQSAARSNPEQRASVNHGWPGVAATPRPGAFHGHDVVGAVKRGAAYNPPPENSGPRPFTRAPSPVHNERRPSLASPPSPSPRTRSVEPTFPQGVPGGEGRRNATRPPVMRQPEAPRPAMSRPMPAPHGPPHGPSQGPPQGPPHQQAAPQHGKDHGKPGPPYG